MGIGAPRAPERKVWQSRSEQSVEDTDRVAIDRPHISVIELLGRPIDHFLTQSLRQQKRFVSPRCSCAVCHILCHVSDVGGYTDVKVSLCSKDLQQLKVLKVMILVHYRSAFDLARFENVSAAGIFPGRPVSQKHEIKPDTSLRSEIVPLKLKIAMRQEVYHHGLRMKENGIHKTGSVQSDQ